MKVVVTGAAGFIGSNLVHGLNSLGIDDVIAVDDLTDGLKYSNLLDAKISDYFDKDNFYARFSCGDFGKVDAVFHEGACSNTMEQDGRFMMETNYRCSKTLLDDCMRQGTRLFYASSAATYGNSSAFQEIPANERPMNVYGYSKLLFDNVVRRMIDKAPAQVVGFRYFNVYGLREQHKGRMASVAFHHRNQWRERGMVKLFGEYGGYGAGEHKRDFVFVDDVVAVNLWFFQNPHARGVFNLGSGRAQSFNDLALASVNTSRALAGEASLPLEMLVAQGLIQYVDFPKELVGKYQCYTQADLSLLRLAGCTHEFADVSTGVSRYFTRLDEQWAGEAGT